MNLSSYFLSISSSNVCILFRFGFHCGRWVRSVLCGVGNHSCTYYVPSENETDSERDMCVWSKALEASDPDGSNLLEPQRNLLLIMAKETDTRRPLYNNANAHAWGLTTHTLTQPQTSPSIIAVFISYLFIKINCKCILYKRRQSKIRK